MMVVKISDIGEVSDGDGVLSDISDVVGSGDGVVVSADDI